MASKKYDRAKIIAQICDRMSEGETLSSICRSKGMPDRNTIGRWEDDDKDVAQHIARARKHGFDAIAERVRETSRGKGDSTDDVQRDKLIVDTDLRLLAKWDRRRYGDALQLSNDPENPFDALSDAQLDERIAAKLAQMQGDDADGEC